MEYYFTSMNKRKQNRDAALQPFLRKKLPIFGVIGPSASAKSTISEMLSKSSKYHLICMKNLQKNEMQKRKWNISYVTRLNESKNLLWELLKEEFIRTYQNSTGYIIDGFPSDLHELKLFERRICQINVIVYLTLRFDALLCRRVAQLQYYDLEKERIQYIENIRSINQIVKKNRHKVIKIPSNYPPEDTCTKLVETLEEYWGYKFLRLYTKR